VARETGRPERRPDTTNEDRLMLFAAISDIHGNSAALDAVLGDVSRRGIGAVVNLGDSLSGPLDPAGTAERLIALDLPTVSGNHDRTLVDRPPEAQALWEQWTYPLLSPRDLDWVRSLPPMLDWNGVLLTHGSPRSDEDNWLHDRDGRGGMRERTLAEVTERAGDWPQRLILSGHTHMPRMVRLPDGRCLVNPGPLGIPAYADPRPPVPTAAMTGAPDARYAICEMVDGDWRIALVTVPYDPSGMIARARANGADDWASALATGWSAV
jgi:predicted phosphodiesterase